MGTSAFDDDYSAGLADVMESMGRTVTYMRPNRDDVTCQAVIEEQAFRETSEDQGLVRVRRRSIHVRTDETTVTAAGGGNDAVVTGIAAPKENDFLTFDDEVWAVESVEVLGSGVAILACVKSDPTELSRPGFRKTRG